MITHQFDVWHLCKNFVKKLVVVGGALKTDFFISPTTI